MEFEGQPTKQEMWERAIKLGLFDGNNIDFDRIEELGNTPQNELQILENK